MRRVLLALGLSLLSGTAWASCPTPLPFTLLNGTVADAGQVMANFNNVWNCGINQASVAITGGTASGLSSLNALNPSTAAITSPGTLVKSVNDGGSFTAAQIYQMAFGPSPTVTTYDLVQGVAVQPTGSTLLGVFGVSAYVLNQNASVGAGTSQNAVGSFAVAVGAATNAATWGANFLVTDNTSQTVSSFHNQKLTILELDSNVWDTTTALYGLLLAGNSGQQPTTSNAILVAQLDVSGANRAKWGVGFNAGSGCCTLGALIGTTALSGNSLSSMPMDFFVTNGSGTVQNWSFTANPLSFTFAHSFGTAITWSFDGNIALPGNTAILMNSDNVLSEDGSHNVLVGNGASVSHIQIGGSALSIIFANPLVFPASTTGAVTPAFTNAPTGCTTVQWIGPFSITSPALSNVYLASCHS